MTPKSDEDISMLLRGKSYRQSLNLVSKSKDRDLIRTIMESDVRTKRQMGEMDEFEPDGFTDKETEEFYDNNWEDIEEEILHEFYKR